MPNNLDTPKFKKILKKPIVYFRKEILKKKKKNPR